MVVWIIGMHGSGKTTIGRALYQQLRKDHQNVIFMNGGDLRAIIGDDLGHDVEDRLIGAGRISRLCRFLSAEGMHVICAVQSPFHTTQAWNREHISDYFEVYLRTSFETRVRRDHQNLYRQALRGAVRNVVGVDIEFVPPAHSDLVIDNDQDLDDVTPLVELIKGRLPLPATTPAGR
jgi:adenylylsulfate kinase